MGSSGRPLADGTELTTLNGEDIGDGTTLNGDDAVGGGVAIRPGVPGTPRLGSGDPTGVETTLKGDDVGTTLNGDEAIGLPRTPEARDEVVKSEARAGDLGGERGGERGGVGRPKVGSDSPATKGEATGTGEAKGEALRLPGATPDAENVGASPAGSRTPDESIGSSWGVTA